MAADMEVAIEPYGIGLRIRTPGRYAMGVGVDVLTFLDGQPDISVKNTGWKNGFGLEVAVSLPIIRTRNLLAEVSTDGEEFHLGRVSGPYEEFADLLHLVGEFLESYSSS